jgi:hypothetical protein
MTLPLPSDGTYGVGLLLGGSLTVLWRQRVALLRAAALPLALMLLQALFQDRAPLQAEPDDAAALDPARADGPWVTLLLAFVNLYAVAIFNVAWYRFLLGYGRPGLWPGLTRAQLRFLARMLLLILLPATPLLLLATSLPAPLLLLAALALIYLALRWSLVLPAAAVGVRLTFRKSWRATRGRALPLFLAPLFGSLVIGAFLSAPLLLLAGMFIDPGGGPPDPFAAFLLWLEFGLLALVIVAQGAAVLAIAVVRLVPDPRNG